MLKGIERRTRPILDKLGDNAPLDVPSSRFVMSRVLILDPRAARELIRDRQKKGIDQHDEVWDGVYVMPPLANNAHQGLISLLTSILNQVITFEGRGRAFPGANVSDRRENWEHSYRTPDIVTVLQHSRAIDCDTHWYGGPEFLVEVRSPGDDTEQKIPFYGKIGVQELLIVHRDTRHLWLYRHDGERLTLAAESLRGARGWLTSQVVPLAFRWKASKAGPRTEINRTDGKKGHWTI